MSSAEGARLSSEGAPVLRAAAARPLIPYLLALTFNNSNGGLSLPSSA
jgi:hypothetical protein